MSARRDDVRHRHALSAALDDDRRWSRRRSRQVVADMTQGLLGGLPQIDRLDQARLGR
jgi:hypothetical protein